MKVYGKEDIGCQAFLTATLKEDEWLRVHDPVARNPDKERQYPRNTRLGRLQRLLRALENKFIARVGKRVV
jgi:hypothetical protein